MLRCLQRLPGGKILIDRGGDVSCVYADEQGDNDQQEDGHVMNFHICSFSMTVIAPASSTDI